MSGENGLRSSLLACYRRDARKANKHIAQGIALG